MRIRFKTNIDLYRTVAWPVLDVVPRKGEKVHVAPASYSYCRHHKIPPSLEVVSVTYYHDEVVVDLWYNETDFKLYGGSEKLL